MIGATVPIYSLQKNHKKIKIFLSWEIFNQLSHNRLQGGFFVP